MRFDIITIFPHIFDSYFNESILKRAQGKKLIQIKIHNSRDFTEDKHKKVDDRPYGGGAGMVLMAEPIIRAVSSVRYRVSRKNKNLRTKVILFSAKGKQFNQKIAYDLAKKYDQLILVSGRYEGIDERAKQILSAKGGSASGGKADLSAKALASVEEISIGPYVLTDGDIPAMVVVSAVSRLLAKVIKFESLEEESYFNSIIQSEAKKGVRGVEYPHYTRPEVIAYKGKKYKAPKVLLSGNHKKIVEWRTSKIK